MRARLNPLLVLVAILGASLAPQLRAQTTDNSRSAAPGVILGGDITLSGVRDSIAALAGSIVLSDVHMGNVAIAGGGVQMISGDIDRLAVAGGTVSLNGGQLGDVFAAAGDLKVNSRMSGDLSVAAGTIVLTKDTTVGGDAALAGGDITIDGAIGKNLSVRADHISLAGTVGGSVSLNAADITIAPGTRIGGNLMYTGPSQLTLPPDVSVGGKIVQGTADLNSKRNRTHFGGPMRAVGIVGFAGLVLCGVVLLLAIPPLLRPMQEILVHAFPMSVLIGFIAACAFPIVIVILFVTVIGIPVALLAMAASAAITGLGLLAVCVRVGDMVRERLGQPDPPVLAKRLGWAAVGFIVFAAVGMIPLAGGLAQGIAILGGSGAVLLSLWRRPWVNA